MTEVPIYERCSTATKALLVVEDDSTAREGMAAVLHAGGYTVDTVPHGEAALTHLRKQKPDLILLDMLMPIMDGWKFLERFQRLDLDIPIIVITGSILTLDWAKQHGCAGFLRKPIDVPELLAEVNRCLPR